MHNRLETVSAWDPTGQHRDVSCPECSVELFAEDTECPVCGLSPAGAAAMRARLDRQWAALVRGIRAARGQS